MLGGSRLNQYYSWSHFRATCPRDIQGETIHEQNVRHNERFPRDSLQVRAFSVSLSSFLWVWPTWWANCALALQGNNNSHKYILGVEVGLLKWTFLWTLQSGWWEGLPELLRGARVFFISVSWQHLIQLQWLRRCWSWGVTWLPLLISAIHN